MANATIRFVATTSRHELLSHEMIDEQILDEFIWTEINYVLRRSNEDSLLAAQLRPLVSIEQNH